MRKSPGFRRWITIPKRDDSTFIHSQNEIENKLPCAKDAIKQNRLLDEYSIPLSDSISIELNREGVRKITQRGDDKFDSRRVYTGHFKPLKKLSIEGKTFYEIETHERKIGNMKEIINYLKSQGGVVSSYDISDAINALVAGVPLPIEEGHAALGVYLDNGTLNLCLKPYYITDEQSKIGFECQKAITEPLTKESIQQYINILNYWHDYETSIALSYGIMASFAYVLREQGLLFCYLFHSSPESGLGKSLVSNIFSQNLFGIGSQPMSAIFSDFRLADALDSFCGPMTIDECLHFQWNGKLGDKIKQAAERPTQDKRGNSNLTSRRYLSRLVPLFTANGFPIDGKADLVRFFRVEYDQTKKSDRNDRKKSKTLIQDVRKLRPIGFRLVEHELHDIDYNMNELIHRIESHADEIVESYSDAFLDSRRPTSWGIVYEGLMAWDRICKEYEIDWAAPDIDTFCKQIVYPIETTTFESKQIPIEDFLDWFESFLVTDRIYGRDYDEYKSENRLWANKTIEYQGRQIEGYVITNPILKKYKQENKRSAIKNMGDLARGASTLSDLPRNEIYDPKRFKIGGKTKKGVFLAASIFSPEKSGNSVINGSPTGEKEGYSQNVFKYYDSNPPQREKNTTSYRVTAQNEKRRIYDENEEEVKKKHLNKAKQFLIKHPKTKFNLDKLCIAVGLGGIKGKQYLKDLLNDDIIQHGEYSVFMKHDDGGQCWSLRGTAD